MVRQWFLSTQKKERPLSLLIAELSYVLYVHTVHSMYDQEERSS